MLLCATNENLSLVPEDAMLLVTKKWKINKTARSNTLM